MVSTAHHVHLELIDWRASFRVLMLIMTLLPLSCDLALFCRYRLSRRPCPVRQCSVPDLNGYIQRIFPSLLPLTFTQYLPCIRRWFYKVNKPTCASRDIALEGERKLREIKDTRRNQQSLPGGDASWVNWWLEISQARGEKHCRLGDYVSKDTGREMAETWGRLSALPGVGTTQEAKNEES